MKVQQGQRFFPLPTEINRKLKISKESITTVCFIDAFKVSVYIDKVPSFQYIEASMSLALFAANFSPANMSPNDAYKTTKHFPKEYPLYFNRVLGV